MLIAKQLAMFLVSPLCLSLCFLAFSIHMYRKGKLRAVRNLTIISFSLLLVFSQHWVANLLLYPLEFTTTHKNTNEFKPEYIFVPACYFHTKGNIPRITRWHECSSQRMLQAITLHKKHQLPIIVTGGNFLTEQDIVFAEEARKFLLNFGVDDDDIIVIAKGWNTKSEIEAVKSLLPNASLQAVTSATHQLRLSYLLSDAGLQHKVESVDYHSSGELGFFLSLPSPTALESVRKATYEYLAIIKYALYDSSKEEIDQ